MALSAGTVTIDGSGVASGGGLARAIYDGQIALAAAFFAEISASAQIEFKEGQAAFANAFASSLVTYLVANAEIEVTIETGDSGLQRTPDPNNANTDTQGPSVEKTLAGTLS